MSREKKRYDREEAKRLLHHGTTEELEAIIKQAGILIDVRGPYPTVLKGMRSQKAASYNEAIVIAASIALGLTSFD